MSEYLYKMTLNIASAALLLIVEFSFIMASHLYDVCACNLQKNAMPSPHSNGLVLTLNRS